MVYQVLAVIATLLCISCSKESEMSRIDELSAVDSITSGDAVPIFDVSNGDARKASLAVFQEYMQANLDFGSDDSFTTMLLTEGTFGYTAVLTGSGNIHVICTETDAATIGFSWFLDDNVIDGQEVIVTTACDLSISFSGAQPTRVGWPSTLSAGGFFKVRYVEQTDTWYRIG